MYGVPLSDLGESPYPACNPGQGDVFAQVPNLLNGNIMDVLFANSTQIERGEGIVFPKGMAFKITTEGREVATTIHWVNATADTLTSEVVYDFFTMPESELTEELVPFVFDNQAFSIAPHTTGDIVTTCDITDPSAHIVSLMPHSHQRSVDFTVDLLGSPDGPSRIYTGGPYNVESDIRIFDEPISLEGFTQIEHRCTVENDLDEPIVHGIGNNEMCTLFGYLYPPSAQQLGYVASGSTSCLAVNIGMYR
jgi:hypothetical protein